MGEAQDRAEETTGTAFKRIKALAVNAQHRIGYVIPLNEDLENWLAAELAAAKAEAWDEGQKSGLRYADRAIKAHNIGRPDLPGPPSPNPYRTERTTDDR